MLLDKIHAEGTPDLTVSSNDRLRPGKLFSCFELERPLRADSTGAVWLAQDYGVKRRADQAELKFLPDFIVGDKIALKKLRSEIRRLASLKHRNILRVYDLVESDGSVAIQIEHEDGQSLSDLRETKANRAFEVRELGKWVKEVCEALEYLHKDLGLIDGNISPRNLILNPAGNLKLKDFGIAKCISDAMGRSMAIRECDETLPYRSSQWLAGDEPAVTDDVYSLGATIYELLTGRPPFFGGDVGAGVISEIPPSMSDRRAELGVTGEAIPTNWEETVAACLAKDPLQRPKSASEVNERLQIAISQPDAPATHIVKSRRKHSVHSSFTRMLRLLIAGIIFILGASSVIAFLWFRPAAGSDSGSIVRDTVPAAENDFLRRAARRANPPVIENLSPDDQAPAPDVNPTPAPALSPTPVPRAGLTPAAEASPTPVMEASPTPVMEASPTPVMEASPTPAVAVSPTPAVAVSPTPAVALSPASTAEASATPIVEVDPTPVAKQNAGMSSTLSQPEPAARDEKQAGGESPIGVSQHRIGETTRAVIERIKVLPEASAEKKANLIEKMYKARSIERLTVIPFGVGQSALRRAGAENVVKLFDRREIRDKLSDPTTILVVAGYADTGGREDVNLRISKERAENVSKILREQANVFNAIQTVGMGGTEVLDSGRPDQNRAVEIWSVVPF